MTCALLSEETRDGVKFRGAGSILRSAPLRWRSRCVTREDAGLQVWLQPVALAHHRPPVGGGAVPLGRPPKP